MFISRTRTISDKTEVNQQGLSFVQTGVGGRGAPGPSLRSRRAQGQWLGLDGAPRKPERKMVAPGVARGEASDKERALISPFS